MMQFVHIDLKGAPFRPRPFGNFWECFCAMLSKWGATGIILEWEDSVEVTTSKPTANFTQHTHNTFSDPFVWKWSGHLCLHLWRGRMDCGDGAEEQPTSGWLIYSYWQETGTYFYDLHNEQLIVRGHFLIANRQAMFGIGRIKTPILKARPMLSYNPMLKLTKPHSLKHLQQWILFNLGMSRDMFRKKKLRDHL